MEALGALLSAALATQLPPSRLRIPSAGSSPDSVQMSPSATGETEQTSSVLLWKRYVVALNRPAFLASGRVLQVNRIASLSIN